MARIRTIKPEFFTSEDIVGMTPLARLFYVSLWCESDREGRLEWKPGTFKMRYLPGDSCDVNELAKELTAKGLIVLYTVDGKNYAEIPTFTEHQVINNRESESTIPAHDKNASRTRAPRVKAEGKGREGRKGKEPVLCSPAFTEFWNAWPTGERKQDKKACSEKWVLHGLDDVLPLILTDIAAKKLTNKWQSGFVEMPETYLNNRRWEDNLTTDGQADSTGWDETRKGIEKRAAELDIPAWDECEQFPIYKARVMAAHQQGAH